MAAFVAVGGNSDRTGYVLASKLISILRDEFDMTINIEVFFDFYFLKISKLLEKADINGSGQIEYKEFRELLTSRI